ncbi:hypothetical protein JOQ06_019801, partial [Pogonophryne albipinna]
GLLLGSCGLLTLPCLLSVPRGYTSVDWDSSDFISRSVVFEDPSCFLCLGGASVMTNPVNTAQVQASSWPQLDSCWYPALFPPHGMGEGILPIHTNITSLLVVDGAGCELVEMDDHKLIARGWPVAKLLEYQWEDPLLTK